MACLSAGTRWPVRQHDALQTALGAQTDQLRRGKLEANAKKSDLCGLLHVLRRAPLTGFVGITID